MVQHGCWAGGIFGQVGSRGLGDTDLVAGVVWGVVGLEPARQIMMLQHSLRRFVEAE